MTYEEFERHLLGLVYEQGMAKLQPSYLAYALKLPHEQVSHYLKEAMAQGILEVNFTDDGHLEYYVPGFDGTSSLPTPLWKRDDEPVPTPEPSAQGGVDGDSQDQRGGRQVSPTLESYIEARYGKTDGQVQSAPVGHVMARQVVIGQAASPQTPPSQAMVPYQGERHTSSSAMVQVESPGDAFCDPSQTIFMRQIRVHGVQSEALLRDHIQRLFESFGYKVVNQGQERMRFERGSITFILALVPLFVLILPLFVYLFLYCMGRSTIQQEPLELDVQIKRGQQAQSYDIDLTFIGLHGVVLGAADQRVLNQEIDTLRDELNWALTGS